MRLIFSRFTLFFTGLITTFLLMGVTAVYAADVTVDTLNDVNDTGVDCGLMVIGDLPGTDTKVSLREALCVTANNAEVDNIDFSVSGTITLASTLSFEEPDGLILDGGNSITLDGDGGSVGGLNVAGSNIEIRNISLIDLSETAAYMGGSNNGLKNVEITNPADVNNGSGVQIFGDGIKIENSFIGTLSDGVTKDAFYTGIYIMGGASNARIENNVITGAGGCGINGWVGDPIGAVKIANNYINIASDGSTVLDGGYGGICDLASNVFNGKVEILNNTISGSAVDGAYLQGTYIGNLFIQGNKFGTNTAGTAAKGNGSNGLNIEAACPVGTCLIGGPEKGNVFSGNAQNGIRFGNGATNFVLIDNVIGADSTTSTAIPNGVNGVLIVGDATGIQIGGNTAPATYLNMISGNTESGIRLQNTTGVITISSNRIGINGGATAALPNGYDGILVNGGSPNLAIGLEDAGIMNIISGNGLHGIRVKDTTGGIIKIMGCNIGSSDMQDVAVPNVKQAILIDGDLGNAANITIGNNNLEQGYNVIMGNSSDPATYNAIKIDDGSSASIEGNHIGTSKNQAFVPGNGGDGNDAILVLGDNVAIKGNIIVGAEGVVDGGFPAAQINIKASAANTLIKGNYIGINSIGFGLGTKNNYGILDAGSGTIIGSVEEGGGNYFGNLERAIHLAGTEGTLVIGNYLGVRPNGTPIVGGTLKNGIVLVSDTSGVTIGGGTANHRNVIGNVTTEGIVLNGASNTSILGNFIGVAPDGVTDFGNGSHGILIVNAMDTFIGRSGETYMPNIISGNAGKGVVISDVGAVTTVYIQGNRIGTNSLATLAIPNDLDGVSVLGGSGVVIGGVTVADRNIISGNTGNGINVNGADGLIIQGNYIGHGAQLATAIPNGGSGIELINGASGVTIGVPYSATIDGTRRNFIDNNVGAGIKLDGVATGQNSLRGNFVGTNNGATFSFANGANNSTSLLSTTVGTHTTAMVAGATNLTGKVDYYSINSSDQITYQGSSVINGNSKFSLQKAFGTTVSDRYFIQITTPAGNSTGYGLYKYVVAGDGPSIPVVTSNTSPKNSSPVLIEGTKDEYTSVDLNGEEIVALDELTTWTHSVDLVEGLNQLIFISKDAGENESLPLIINMVLDTIPPLPPIVNASSLVTGGVANPTYRITGLKPANTSVWVNGNLAVGLNTNTGWIYDAQLTAGPNVFNFVTKDGANNVSAAAQIVINYVQVPYYDGGVVNSGTSSPIGGGGSGGSGGVSAPASVPAPAPAAPVPAPGTETTSTSDSNADVNTSGSSTQNEAPATQNPPANTEEVVNEVKDTYPVYTPNTTPVKPPVTPLPPKPPVVVAPQAPAGTQTPNTEGATNLGPAKPLYPAPPASTKFQNILGVVNPVQTPNSSSAADGAAGTSNNNEAETNQPAVGVTLPGTKSAGQQITIPSNMINLDSIKVKAEQQGIFIPNGVTDTSGTAANQEAAVPVVKNPVPTRQTLAPVLGTEAYAAISDDLNNNGVPDIKEKQFGEKGIDLEADDDGDGMSNAIEILMGTDPLNVDGDGDGIEDGVELILGTNTQFADSDQDGKSDAEELAAGTDPTNSDSDGDGVLDIVDENPNDASVGISDDDGDGISNAVETRYASSGVGQAQTVTMTTSTGETKEIVISERMRDTDGDGLTDRDEMMIGSDPTNPDSDGDGKTDGEERKLFGTNPIVEDAPSKQPGLVRQAQGATFNTPQPVVPGYATPNAPVTIYFIPRVEGEAGATASSGFLSSLAHYLTANLFTEQAEDGYYKVDTVADAGGKFLAKADLPNGDYDVVVRTYGADGSLEDESLPFEIKVDTEALASGSVQPYQLDDQLIDMADLKVLTLDNGRPYLYGKAPRDYEVEVLWASELFTSSLLVESEEEMGEFVVMAPQLLPDGDHGVTVHGVDLAQNLYTAAINVDFVVLASVTDLAEDDPMARMKVLGVGAGAIFILVTFWLIARTKKQQYE